MHLKDWTGRGKLEGDGREKAVGILKGGK